MIGDLIGRGGDLIGQKKSDLIGDCEQLFMFIENKYISSVEWHLLTPKTALEKVKIVKKLKSLKKLLVLTDFTFSYSF